MHTTHSSFKPRTFLKRKSSPSFIKHILLRMLGNISLKLRGFCSRQKTPPTLSINIYLLQRLKELSNIPNPCSPQCRLSYLCAHHRRDRKLWPVPLEIAEPGACGVSDVNREPVAGVWVQAASLMLTAAVSSQSPHSCRTDPLCSRHLRPSKQHAEELQGRGERFTVQAAAFLLFPN